MCDVYLLQLLINNPVFYYSIIYYIIIYYIIIINIVRLMVTLPVSTSSWRFRQG